MSTKWRIIGALLGLGYSVYELVDAILERKEQISDEQNK
jgi:hypothetical protein